MGIELLGSEQSIREDREKSRLQSAFEFFEVLQKEFLVNELRSQIYPSKKDKAYWTRVMNQKKITIEQVSAANGGWPTIFDDESKYKEYKSHLLNKSGLPNFIYRNRDDENVQGYLDMVNWFAVGKTVNVDFDGEPKAAVIIEFTPYRSNGLKLKLASTGETILVSEKNVTRII